MGREQLNLWLEEENSKKVDQAVIKLMTDHGYSNKGASRSNIAYRILDPILGTMTVEQIVQAVLDKEKKEK